MSLGKLVSLIGGLWTAALTAALLLTEQAGLGNILPTGSVATTFIVICGGAIATLLAYLLIGAMIDHDLSRLRRLIESHRTGEPVGGVPSSFYLRGLGQSIEQVLNSQQQRIESLTGQRRELEIQTRISEAERQHAEAIFQSISDAVLVTDAFNEVALANEAASQVLQFDLEEARHQPVERLLRDPALVKLIRDTRESSNPNNRRHVEHPINTDSRQQVFDVTLACVTNPQSEVAGVVTILHDITREKQVSQMKSSFVSSVSHELRTPLSSIKAYVEMLVDGEAPDEPTRQEFYSIIQSEANRLSRLIDNILNISRIESGIVKVQREETSLPSVIRDVIDVMAPQARAKQIELSYTETPLFYHVYADRDMIYQATLNLVSNAIKYTPSGGRVCVEAVVDDHRHTVTVSVSDTGVGIPPEALPHLFEKFYRVSEHKKIAKGTGLGLNLVKHIVETVHGGEVSVTSEEGRGSTFRFSLPLSHETP